MNYLEIVCLFLLVVVHISSAAYFTDTWAAHINGGEEFAKALAEEHGFVFLGKVMPDIYSLRHHKVVKRSAFPSPHHHQTLIKHPQVEWMEQQQAKKRVKRDRLFNDPKWPRMWYLNRGGGLDMNVIEAWKLGITGKDIVVSILDDGIEKDHPDLKTNYDALASYDVNGHDRDPQPRYDYTNENRHGTRCAGEVAAEANNGICSVGVAYRARIGGVRMLDGDVTDSVEAQSLSHNPQHIDIYSASWGPDDDGRTVDGPASLARKAFHDGIKAGRYNRGSIFVWASGNGGRDYDSCNCDGYTNSIYTLSISSATEAGNIPWYSEACSSTLATTYSSGSGSERQIVTTDLRKSCTEGHTGTSASAPLAAGICALALEANPDLTWRDMQHIVVMTARTANLRADDWVVNGVGRNVSHSFGYGLMDAGAMVKLAKDWTNVPPQHKCQIHSTEAKKGIPVNNQISVRLHSDGCRGTGNEVLFLEHVQAIITLSTQKRGEMKVYLRSPAGTRSILLAQRPRDTSSDGFNNWAFMTTHSWGEYSIGTWTLEVHSGSSTAELRNWELVLYGTERPTHSSSTGIQHRPNHPQQPHQGCEDPDKPFYLDGSCFSSCPESFYPTTESVRVTNQSISDAKGDRRSIINSGFNSLPPASTAASSASSPSSSELITTTVSSVMSSPATTIMVDINETIQIQTCSVCAPHCSNCTGPGVDECIDCVIDYHMNINVSRACLPNHSVRQFVANHIVVAIAILVSAGALLVYVFVFTGLHIYSKHKEKGYLLAGNNDDDGDGSNNNGAITGMRYVKNNKNNQAARDNDNERVGLLNEDSDSDLENEIYDFGNAPHSNV